MSPSGVDGDRNKCKTGVNVGRCSYGDNMSVLGLQLVLLMINEALQRHDASPLRCCCTKCAVMVPLLQRPAILENLLRNVAAHQTHMDYSKTTLTLTGQLGLLCVSS